MPDYKKMYFKMFNRITDIIISLQNIQKEAEMIYIKTCEQEEKGITNIKDINNSKNL